MCCGVPKLNKAELMSLFLGRSSHFRCISPEIARTLVMCHVADYKSLRQQQPFLHSSITSTYMVFECMEQLQYVLSSKTDAE